MDNAQFNYYLSKTDKVIYYLETPPDPTSLCSRISRFVSNIFIYIARFFNYIFGDHHWYNELKARSIIQFYINHYVELQNDRAIRNTMVTIKNLLLQLPDGNGGTYGDNLNIPNPPEAPKPPIAALAWSNPPPVAPIPPPASAPVVQPVIRTPLIYQKEHQFKLKPLQTFPDIQRLLFHFHANEFGAGSDLEGAGPQALEYFHHYLDSWVKDNPQPIVSNFAQQLRKAIELAKCPSVEQYVKLAYRELELAIKADTSLFIFGGWSGKPGHAIYYEIIPESRDKATFRLYNTGAGLENHIQGLVGVKIKYQPYLDWKGIDIAAFFSPFFFKSLYELKKPSQLPSRDHPFDQNDIYTGLKNILKPISEVPGAPTFLMSEQYSGICTIRGLLAALRTSLEMSGKDGDKVYRYLKCDIMITSLRDAIVSDVLPPKDKKTWIDQKIFWVLVEKSARKTARRVYKNFNKNIVNARYLEDAKKALEPIYKWLATNETQIKTLHFQPINPHSISHPNVHIEAFEKSFQTQATLASHTLCNTDINIIESFKKLLNEYSITPNKIGQFLTQDLQKISHQAWLQRADQSLYTGLLLWIKNLPLNKEFWIDQCKDVKGAQSFIT